MIGAVLAGGENRRIPLLKSHIELGEGRIIDATLKLLKDFFEKVVVSTNTPEFYFYCGVQLVGDILPQKGPATGILSVLINTNDDAVFVAACDMPFISKSMVSLLIKKYYANDKKLDAVIPVFDSRIQPLIGVYSKSIFSIMENKIVKGTNSLKEILADANVLFIDELEISQADPEGMSFVNINTIEDLENAQKLLQTENKN
jgi:molybdopterin-guanine dinucleotide biosynthesis protein A